MKLYFIMFLRFRWDCKVLQLLSFKGTEISIFSASSLEEGFSAGITGTSISIILLVHFEVVPKPSNGTLIKIFLVGLKRVLGFQVVEKSLMYLINQTNF